MRADDERGRQDESEKDVLALKRVIAQVAPIVTYAGRRRQAVRRKRFDRNILRISIPTVSPAVERRSGRKSKQGVRQGGYTYTFLAGH